MVDAQLGLILDTLEKHHLFDNTVIVFTSDHGEMMGAHRLIAKKVFYEESVAVPMMMKIPGFTPNRVSQPVSQIDLVPTLLDVLGYKPEFNIPPLPGTSWIPYLQGKGTLSDDVYIEWNHEKVLKAVPEKYTHLACDQDKLLKSLNSSSRAIIYQHWKYVESNIGEHELYDLTNDPLEMNNQYGDAAYEHIISDLSQRLDKWRLRTQDDF